MENAMGGDVGVQMLQAIQEIRTEMGRMNTQIQILMVRADKQDSWMERFAAELVMLRTEMTTGFNQIRVEMLQFRKELHEVRVKVG